MPDAAPSSPRPRKRATPAPARALAAAAVGAMLEKKAAEVAVIDVRHVSGVADYFVIGTGDSDLQVRAVVEGVQERVREHIGERPWKREGTEHNQWVVLDYVDVVVHVFDRERRAYYDLERLWGDAPIERVAEDAAEVALLRPEAGP